MISAEGADTEKGAKSKLDDFVKSPSAVLCFIATTKITKKHEEKE